MCEIRFAEASPSAGMLLPGLLHSKHSRVLQRIERLPTADIPLPIREHDDNLRYAADFRLIGDDCAVGVGSRVLSFSVVKNYTSWAAFKKKALPVLRTAIAAGQIPEIERFSIKFINFISESDVARYFVYNISLGDDGAVPDVFQFQTQRRVGKYTSLVTLLSNASVGLGGEQRSGAILDIDLVDESAAGFKSDMESRLDEAHQLVRRIFFDMCSPEALSEWGAVYSVRKV